MRSCTTTTVTGTTPPWAAHPHHAHTTSLALTASDGAPATTFDYPADEGPGDDPNPGELFADRVDTQAEDQEREVGVAARLSGYTAAVTAIEDVASISDFENAGYLRVSVDITNRDDSSQSYSLFDWRLQTPQGQVIDPTFTLAATLESGDLVAGGNVTGDVYFEIGDATGDFFVIYKPDPFDAARGIWKHTR